MQPSHFAASALTLATTTAALAGPACNQPQTRWMKAADFKAKLVEQGHQIKSFKVSKGQCCEIYGHDKAGKKIEIAFDPVTAALLEQK